MVHKKQIATNTQQTKSETGPPERQRLYVSASEEFRGCDFTVRLGFRDA